MSFKVYGTPVFERQRKRLTRKFPLLNIEIESLIADLKQFLLPHCLEHSFPITYVNNIRNSKTIQTSLE
jgi:hypothetical protein